MDANNKSEAKAPTQDELIAMQAAQAETLAAKEARIKQLMADLEEANAAKAEVKVVVVNSGIPVTVNKKKYLVVHGIITADGRKTAEQIAADKTLCESLVKGNSSALKEIL